MTSTDVQLRTIQEVIQSSRLGLNDRPQITREFLGNTTLGPMVRISDY